MVLILPVLPHPVLIATALAADALIAIVPVPTATLKLTTTLVLTATIKRFATAHELITKSLLRLDGTVATEQDHTEGQSQSPQRSAQTAPEGDNGADVAATVDK